MGYEATDSSGTDDDLPPSHLNRGIRVGHGTGNSKGVAKSSQYTKSSNDMEAEIHRLEQEAYSSVLRAFQAQSDAITWEKEGLMTELRKELRVSDKEHRELLAAVNADGIIQRIRDWRHTGTMQCGLLNNLLPVQDRAPSPISTSHKKQKTSHPIPSPSLGAPSPGPNSQTVAAATQPLLSPTKRVAPPLGIRGKTTTSVQSLRRVQSMKSVQYSSNSPIERGQIASQDTSNAPATVQTAKVATVDPLTGRRVLTRWPEDNNIYQAVINDYNPVEFSPNDIRWDGEDPDISRRASHGGPGSGMKKFLEHGETISGAGSGRGSMKNQHKDNFHSLQNGSCNLGLCDIEIFNTDVLIKEVQKVFGSSQPDPLDVEKAKKLLKFQEKSLITALERIANASDGDSGGKDHQFMHGQPNKLEKGWKRRQHPGRHHAGSYS